MAVLCRDFVLATKIVGEIWVINAANRPTCFWARLKTRYRVSVGFWMGTSSGANFHQQLPQGMPPPRHNGGAPSQQTYLSLASLEQVGSPDMQDPASNSGSPGHDSATESASSRETWPVEPSKSGGPATAAAAARIVDKDKEVATKDVAERQVIRRIPSTGRVTLREVARDRVDLVAEKMKVMPEELLDDIKTELRSILEGSGGPQHIEEFLYLQKLVQGRVDLTPTMLLMAHHVQLEILVSIKTGIQAFLHPSVNIPLGHLAEVFLYRRCRNIACQSALPAEECRCNICGNRNGFCNLCMCVICNKFDFEVNTCRWIGCDSCSHWTHTDCAIRDGQIGTGQKIKNGIGHAEMLFRCQACQRTSELLGWVRDVFQQCAPGWDRDALLRELEYVRKIFRLSEDSKGRNLFRRSADLIERLRSGTAQSMSPRALLQALQELEMDFPKISENEELGRLISPHEACNRIAEVVQEAVRKMELVAEEKLRMVKKARHAVESCDRELEEKAREAREIQAERVRKQQQVVELESIVRLKSAEAEMFQLKANEARQEAEQLLSIAQAKSEKAEQDYASMYLKRRLEEAEAEKQYIFEKIRLQETQRPVPPPPQASSSRAASGAAPGEQSQMMMLSKIQDLLKNVRSMPSGKSDGQLSK